MSIQRIRPCPKRWLVSVCVFDLVEGRRHIHETGRSFRSSRTRQPSYSPVFDGLAAQSECHRGVRIRHCFPSGSSSCMHLFNVSDTTGPYSCVSTSIQRIVRWPCAHFSMPILGTGVSFPFHGINRQRQMFFIRRITCSLYVRSIECK